LAHGVRDVCVIGGRFTGRFLVGLYPTDVSREIDPRQRPHQARDVTITGADIDALEANLKPADSPHERYQPTLTLVRTTIGTSLRVLGDRARMSVVDCRIHTTP
jgi:hypothetical protein